MYSRTLSTLMAAALVANVSWKAADASDLGAALVGGVIGAAIMDSANKSKKKRYSSSGYSVQRQANRDMQSALNYFGFPAGTPDGVIGGRTRTAASQFQVFMNFPPTGTLTPYERDFLVSAYNRAQIGGPEVIRAMQRREGVRGLLVAWRDEATGFRTGSTAYGGLPVEVADAIDEIAQSTEPSAEQLMQRSGFMLLADLNGDGKNDYIIDTSVTGSSFWCGASHCTVMVFASTPQGYQRSDFQARGVTAASFSCHQSVCRLNQRGQEQTELASSQPQPQVQQPQVQQPQAQQSAQQQTGGTVLASAGGQGASGLQAFSIKGQDEPQQSLTSLCGKVGLLTNSNGGFVTLASMQDPVFALSEQMCLARTYAIGDGETLVSKVQGASAAQIDAQCDGFGPALEPFVAMLSQNEAVEIRSAVQKFALETNMTLEQLNSTARICLFSGYRRDNTNVALGSALILVAIGQTPYAELVGHHLAHGIGTQELPERAQDWYNLAVTALENGTDPVFAPGQPERVALIKAASAGLTGGGLVTPTAGSALPTFKLD